MNILHISPYYPSLKARHAGGFLMAKEIEVLSIVSKIVILSFVKKNEKTNDKFSSNTENVFTNKINLFRKFINILFNPKLPVLFSIYYEQRFLKKIFKLIKKYNIDIIYAEYSQIGVYFKEIRKKFPTIIIIYVLHDVVLQSYIRKIEKLDNHHLPRFFKIFQMTYLKLQKNKILHYEKKFLNYTNEVVVVSEKDNNLLSSFYNFSKAIVLKPYVNLLENSSLKNTGINNNNERKDIFFFGKMNRIENHLSALKLIKLFKLSKLESQEIKLHIIGANPRKSLMKLKSNSIIIHGYLQDPSNIMLNCRAAIYPIELGAGVKIKVLEALKFGIPVITNLTGAEGIDEEGNIVFLVKNDEDYFAQFKKVLEYSDEELQNYQLNAKNFLKEKFNWESSKDTILNLIKKYE